MFNATAENRGHIAGVLDALLRVQREGLEDRFDMVTYADRRPCGTSHCAWGWYIHFSGVRVSQDDYRLTKSIAGTPGTGLWSFLFGLRNGSGPDALARQIKRTRWALARLDAMLDYERYQSAPKAQRRDWDKERRLAGITAQAFRLPVGVDA